MSVQIYMGEVVDVEGTTPGPAPTYIIKWLESSGFKQLNGVRPAHWTWDSLGVDEDGAKTVADHTAVIVCRQADTYAFIFVPAPLVGTCSGTEGLAEALAKMSENLAKAAMEGTDAAA